MTTALLSGATVLRRDETRRGLQESRPYRCQCPEPYLSGVCIHSSVESRVGYFQKQRRRQHRRSLRESPGPARETAETTDDQEHRDDRRSTCSGWSFVPTPKASPACAELASPRKHAKRARRSSQARVPHPSTPEASARENSVPRSVLEEAESWTGPEVFSGRD